MKPNKETKPDKQLISEHKAYIKELRKHLSEYYSSYREYKRLYESQVKISESVKENHESTRTSLTWYMKQFAVLVDRLAELTKHLVESATIISRQRDLLKMHGILDDTQIQNKIENSNLKESSAIWINNRVLSVALWYLPTRMKKRKE